MNVASEVVRHLVILLLTVTIGTIGGVMRLHYRAWRRSPSGDRLVPLHVAMISSAQLCFLIGAALGVLDALEDPFSYRTFLYVSGSMLTLVALFIIGRVQRRRVKGRRSTKNDTRLKDRTRE